MFPWGKHTYLDSSTQQLKIKRYYTNNMINYLNITASVFRNFSRNRLIFSRALLASYCAPGVCLTTRRPQAHWNLWCATGMIIFNNILVCDSNLQFCMCQYSNTIAKMYLKPISRSLRFHCQWDTTMNILQW